MKSLLLFTMALAISGCNIYQSKERKEFESAAPGKTTLSLFCWAQPATEPLWNTEAKILSVTKLQIKDDKKELIEVCIQD